MEGQASVRRRLGVDETGTSASQVLKDERIRNPALQWVEAAFLSSADERAKLRGDLAQAGFEQPAAPSWYVVIRFAMAIGLPMLFIFANAVSGKGGGGPATILAPLALSGISLIAPRMFIQSRARAQRQSIEHQFPDALDLMVVCVEAGLGLDAAFVKVGSEISRSHPQIAHEFDRLADELNAGRGRSEALRSMSARLEVESIKAFVALLVQTEALGVSVAQGLRTYSAEMRETRFLNAEEKAMRIPILMTVPLVAFLMPVIVVALLLPPAIDVIRTLLPTMTGS